MTFEIPDKLVVECLTEMVRTGQIPQSEFDIERLEALTRELLRAGYGQPLLSRRPPEALA